MFTHFPLAYLDPGTGSLIVQTMIATVLGALIVFRSFWKGLFYNIKTGLSGQKSDPTGPTDEETP